MKCKRLLLSVSFLFATCSLVSAQEAAQAPTKILHNADVLNLYRAGMKPGQIIAKIISSPCNFDTFPPVLRELKSKGLPDTVIVAMRMVPYGPPASDMAVPFNELAPQASRIQIPAGTLIEIQTVSKISSASANEGDRIKFLVARRVMVNGVMVIDRGATARARIVKVKPAGAWGSGGLLSWVMEDVDAVDGTHVPIKLSDRVAGKNRRKAVVAAAIATGAAVFPYSPPVGLIWALKKGDEAELDQSKQAAAMVADNTEVVGLMPQKRKVTYDSVERLKLVNSATQTDLGPTNNSFRPTPIGKH